METILTIYISPQEFEYRPVAFEPEYKQVNPLDTRIPLEVDCNQWPHPPNLPCWDCTNTLDNQVWFIPRRFCNKDQTRFVPLGCFCSLPCMYHFVSMQPKLHYLYDNIRIVVNIRCGKIPYIILSPPDPHTNLAKFGVGNMTVEEHREVLRAMESEMFFRPGMVGSAETHQSAQRF